MAVVTLPLGPERNKCAGCFKYLGAALNAQLPLRNPPVRYCTVFAEAFPMSPPGESEFKVPHIPGPALRKLIRSKGTKAFLTADGGWSKDMAGAAVFEDHSAAVTAKRQFQLDGKVELYYSFEYPRMSEWDFTMEL